VERRLHIGLRTLRSLSRAGLLALSLSLTPVSAMAIAAVPAWTTYDHDGLRTAIDPDSRSPVTPTPAWVAAAQLDGPVYAQPLVYGSFVYVATENDTIYALDAATGAVVWQRSIGTAVPAGALPCGDIQPAVGITSTPTIDPADGRIYAVADTLSGSTVQHQLVALDLATGALVAGFPVAVDPPGADPTALLQRASLALDGGRVIIPYGGNAGDCGVYHGWLVSAAEDGTGTPSTFEVDPGAGEHGGAIWGSGDGPSLDAAGHVFVSTGNGFGSTTPDLQESVLELDPSLNLVASWTAPNWQALDNSDLDLGSSEPLPLPGGLLFVVGKDGVGRLLSEGALGSAGQVFSAPACGSGGGYGASLYQAGVIYVPCSGGLAALSLSLSPGPSFSPLTGWGAPTAASGPPILAGGLVWSTGWRSSGILYGLDPATGAIRFQATLGTFNHFATPSAGGGRLFVAVGSTLTALTISSFPPATSTALSSSANPSKAGAPFELTATVNPAPDGGTVAFDEAGKALAGCGAVGVDPATGQARCPASLRIGSHALLAAYSGDPYFGPSTSAPVSEVIDPVPPAPAHHPRLSAVRLGTSRFTATRGTRLILTLSEPATLHVQVSRRLSGRKLKGRCTVGAKQGRRCTKTRRARRLTLNGKRGRNRLKLNLRRLRPGNYLVTVVARAASGAKSNTFTLRFEIVRPRR
jgi:outer membrane protein assembly factor BamB